MDQPRTTSKTKTSSRPWQCNYVLQLLDLNHKIKRDDITAQISSYILVDIINN